METDKILLNCGIRYQTHCTANSMWTFTNQNTSATRRKVLPEHLPYKFVETSMCAFIN